MAWAPAAAIIGWLAAINAATYVAFAADKRRAREHGRRISERTLLTLAMLGGSPAAFVAQQRLRHKTRKQPFAGLLVLIAAALLAFGGLAVLLR